MNQNVEALLKTLPRKIKVGAYDYQVKLHDELTDEDTWGDHDARSYQINMYGTNEMASPEFCVGILLHELLHAIWDAEHLDGWVGDLEETVVCGYEVGLIALFRDNPKFLTWIKKGLK